MDQFVAAGNIDRGAGLAQDGMPQRKCHRTLAIEESSEQPLDAAAIELNNPSSYLRPATSTKPDATQNQAKQCVW